MGTNLRLKLLFLVFFSASGVAQASTNPTLGRKMPFPEAAFLFPSRPDSEIKEAGTTADGRAWASVTYTKDFAEENRGVAFHATVVRYTRDGKPVNLEDSESMMRAYVWSAEREGCELEGPVQYDRMADGAGHVLRWTCSKETKVADHTVKTKFFNSVTISRNCAVFLNYFAVSANSTDVPVDGKAIVRYLTSVRRTAN